MPSVGIARGNEATAGNSNSSSGRRAALTLAVGALHPTSAPPTLTGSFILWDTSTGLGTTCAHVVLDCAAALSSWEEGVAIGVGSADTDIEWLWRASIISISYPPSPHKPAWAPLIANWNRAAIPIAPGAPNLDLAVLRISARLDGRPLAFPISHSRPSGQQLSALPLGDSDTLLLPRRVSALQIGRTSDHVINSPPIPSKSKLIAFLRSHPRLSNPN